MISPIMSGIRFSLLVWSIAFKNAASKEKKNKKASAYSADAFLRFYGIKPEKR